MRFYETLKNVLLRAIAYKFEVRAQVYETLTGFRSRARSTAKELSRVVAQESSGSVVSDTRNVQHALINAGFE